RKGLGLRGKFLADAAKIVVGLFGNHYQELRAFESRIERVLGREEESFISTYASGVHLLDMWLAEGKGFLGGDQAFLLHDTYGLTIELVEELTTELGGKVDRAGFDSAMAAQKERARLRGRFGKSPVGQLASEGWTEIGSTDETEFLGWDSLVASGLNL